MMVRCRCGGRGEHRRECSDVNLKVISDLRCCCVVSGQQMCLAFSPELYVRVGGIVIITLTLNGFTDVWRSLDTHLGPQMHLNRLLGNFPAFSILRKDISPQLAVVEKRTWLSP